MHCNRFDEVASDFLENLVSRDFRKTIERHLSECTRCTSMLERMSTLRNSFQQMQRVETSPHFEQQLQTRVAEELRQGNSNVRRLVPDTRAVFNSRTAMGFAAAASIAMGALAWQQFGPAPMEQFPAASAPTAAAPAAAAPANTSPAAPANTAPTLQQSQQQLTRTPTQNPNNLAVQSDSSGQPGGRDETPPNDLYKDHIQVVKQSQ